MGNDFGADRVSGQVCGHARFTRTSPRRHSDRDRCGIITNLTAAYLVTAMTGQIALSAVMLRSRGAGRLAMRVCMWTGSIVLLTADLTLSIGQVAFYCGSEVIGAAFHWAEAVVLPLVIRPVDPACKWASPLPLNHGYQIASVRFRRILPIAARSGKGLLTEPTAGARPWR
jgi:hypothetical protein